MKTDRIRRSLGLAIPAIAIAALTVIPAATAPAQMVRLDPDRVVQVSVSFNNVVPLADLSEQSLVGTQKRARELVYRLAREECGVLQATIAATCHLNNINVSAQVRDHRNHQPLSLYVNGNYRFTITLKDR